ncbi:unnamed protein product [Nippostrongylus brasiliensis]|uniref:dolichyl-P-Man:Man5GlcNAc2-PP-dolichol alpha-1,3-mannosyltransferase n=1 Tax=Nippostrongylus brasiliensis TaxID=27835 RepID=A0A0N4YK55_NIPBR|nr:unnamed protein product [Nippostrongylus brasiliensis]
MSLKDSVWRLLFTVNSAGFLLMSAVILVVDSIATRNNAPWIDSTIIDTDTEIDWSTYMQQVECYTEKNIRNYSNIGGDTGPVVYPAGHLLTYSVFHYLTSAGKDIRAAQYIFMLIYLINLVVVLWLYYKSNRIAPFVLVFLSFTGYRIHSIFILRLFNDPVAMLFFYLAVMFFISEQWTIGCLLYSFAVSIKMNVLLYAPALFFIMLLNTGLWQTLWNLICCAVLQIAVGLPFLLHDPIAYVRRSFDLGRVFLYKWTVNWRFLPEEIFLSTRFHLMLLLCHLLVLAVFGYHLFVHLTTHFRKSLCGISLFRSHGGLKGSLSKFFNGMRTKINVAALVLIGVEICWNVYPSTVASSAFLNLYHISILVYLFLDYFESSELTKKAN